MGDEPTNDTRYIQKYKYEPIDIGLSFSANSNSENASRVFNEASDNIGTRCVAPPGATLFCVSPPITPSHVDHTP
jgi:hypothetical protein